MQTPAPPCSYQAVFRTTVVSASDEVYKPYFASSSGHSVSPALGVFWFLPCGRTAGRTGGEQPGRGFKASWPINPTSARAFWTRDPPPRVSSPRHAPHCACRIISPSLPAASCTEELCGAWCSHRASAKGIKKPRCWWLVAMLRVQHSRCLGLGRVVLCHPPGRQSLSPSPAALGPETLRGAFLQAEMRRHLFAR